MTREEMKKWIDNATYDQLLGHWRFAPAGDPFFIGEVGEHYKKVMSKRKQEVGLAGHTATSKSLGWE